MVYLECYNSLKLYSIKIARCFINDEFERIWKNMHWSKLCIILIFA